MPSGVAWGHDGSTPGYLTSVLNSRGGGRQVVLMVNGGETAFDRQTAEPAQRLLAAAYCRQHLFEHVRSGGRRESAA